MLLHADQTTHESLSSQAFADRITQTRMDVRLAMRASLRYNTLPPLEQVEEHTVPAQRLREREKASLAQAGYVMEPLAPKVEAILPESIIGDAEDDAWLNDVAQPLPDLPRKHLSQGNGWRKMTH